MSSPVGQNLLEKCTPKFIFLMTAILKSILLKLYASFFMQPLTVHVSDTGSITV